MDSTSTDARIFTSPPAAVAVGPDRLDVFGLGLDYALYHKSYNDQADAAGLHWSPTWENLGGDLTSTPVVLAPTLDRLDVFALGSDQGMLRRTRNADTWSSWEELGGCFTTAPTVLQSGADAFDVFVRGPDFLIYHALVTDGAGVDWAALGGALLREPTAASAPVAVRVHDQLYGFVVASDQAMWFTRFDGTVWRRWSSLGGTFVSDPVAVALAPGSDIQTSDPFSIDLFAVQAHDHGLSHNRRTGEGWQGWDEPSDATTGAGPKAQLACTPAVVAPDHAVNVVSMPPAHFRVAEADLDGTIHLRRFDGTTWTRWDHGPRYRLPSAYLVALDSVTITDTMSAHNDTDVAAATLRIGAWPAESMSYRLGDVNNGVHQLTTNLQFSPVTLDLCEPAMLSWSIANADDSNTEQLVLSVMVKAAEDMINDALKGMIGPAGSIGGAIVSAALDAALGFAFGGCNCIVAEGSVPYVNGRDVQRSAHQGSGGRLVGSVPYTGANSRFWCGDSHYTVAWLVKRTA